MRPFESLIMRIIEFEDLIVLGPPCLWQSAYGGFPRFNTIAIWIPYVGFLFKYGSLHQLPRMAPMMFPQFLPPAPPLHRKLNSPPTSDISGPLLGFKMNFSIKGYWDILAAQL